MDFNKKHRCEWAVQNVLQCVPQKLFHPKIDVGIRLLLRLEEYIHTGATYTYIHIYIPSSK